MQVKKGRHRFESEERDARGTRTDGNEEMSKTDNLLTPPKQSKRKSGDLDADARVKVQEKGAIESAWEEPAGPQVGSKGQDQTYSPQKPFESFSDLTEISQSP